MSRANPPHLSADTPPLKVARAWGDHAATFGFDWPDLGSVRKKVAEELRELDEAIARGEPAHVAEEFGDVLFSLVMLSRHLHLDPETCLHTTNQKFAHRFAHVLRVAQAHPQGAPRDLLEAAWEQAKQEPS